MQEKSTGTGTVTLYVFGMVAGIPVALAGAQVTISPARTPHAHHSEPKLTDGSGACTLELPEGDYTATATFELKPAPLARRKAEGRTRPARRSARSGEESTSQSEQFTGELPPFHVCEGETREYPLEVEDLADVLQIQLGEDPRAFVRGPAERPLHYGQPTYVRVDWDGYETLKTDLDARGAEVERLLGDKTGDLYSVTPRASRVNFILALSSAKSNIPPTADPTMIARLGAAAVPVPVDGPPVSRIEGSISTSLKRSASFQTDDLALSAIIRRAAKAISFDRYMDFMNWIFCGDRRNDFNLSNSYLGQLADVDGRRFLPFTDTDAYRNIKAATEAFLMANCCIYDPESDEPSYIADHVAIDPAQLNLPEVFKNYLGSGSDKILPYLAVIRAKLADERLKDTGIGDIVLRDHNSWPVSPGSDPVAACYGILREKLRCPCLLELIWSYWNEEGMLVQTMNVITRRFQNIRSPGANDPLANLEIDPLRPLNNLLWGWVQDEQHRLSVVRRNYEYDHHYGLRLAGKAVDNARTADSRSKFLEAFHTLLSTLAAFYKRDDDTTMVADGFPVLNALKEAHLILSQGAHNQFGDLPSTARVEMLMLQWILARPEFREFIPTRIMVAYPEPWMDRVDAMKKLQGWTDTSVLHFRNLAI